ncbi:MAG: aminoglycoside 6-adenylyltransferase [Actinobacteria bacterium]|nr:aminoglycoside 6-adenylyltransferase [Actinomycetota bacterium]
MSAVSGILLVGGASERFGSPKALARFRGESLAERAWRLLHEVCDEVLAVGKTGDALELPFAILDDESEQRAPVHGLIAGLRAAANDVCIVLPVDCPLVTGEALRALAGAIAVPQTGPLPGAYSKQMLPDLEAHVARGELSLRGVNPIVLELDENLLLNVNTRTELMTAAVADWAREREEVRALLVVGSQARADTPADRWSDLDLIFFIEDPKPYLEDASWVEEFGVPVVTFLEATLYGHWERRVLYETGEDVDFVLFPASISERLETSKGAAELLARGYRLLIDRAGIAETLERSAAMPRPSGPTQHDFNELASDFWYHALWTAKKLRRGEVFTALDCLDGYMKARVVTLLGWHARSVDPSVDTWHAGRFVERWADPGALAALEKAFAHYDVRDVARALWETIDLWQGLEEETASRLGFVLTLDHRDLRRRVAEIVPDPRHASTLWP